MATSTKDRVSRAAPKPQRAPRVTDDLTQVQIRTLRTLTARDNRGMSSRALGLSGYVVGQLRQKGIIEPDPKHPRGYRRVRKPRSK